MRVLRKTPKENRRNRERQQGLRLNCFEEEAEELKLQWTPLHMKPRTTMCRELMKKPEEKP